MAALHHPDAGGDADTFQLVTEAYEQLIAEGPELKLKPDAESRDSAESTTEPSSAPLKTTTPDFERAKRRRKRNHRKRRKREKLRAESKSRKRKREKLSRENELNQRMGSDPFEKSRGPETDEVEPSSGFTKEYERNNLPWILWGLGVIGLLAIGVASQWLF